MTWNNPPRTGRYAGSPPPYRGPHVPGVDNPGVWGGIPPGPSIPPGPQRKTPGAGTRAAIAIFVAVSVISVAGLFAVAAVVVQRGYGGGLYYSSQKTISRESLERAVVRVRGEACNFEKHGTGFFAEPGLIVTNAHVVAGIDNPSVGLTSWGGQLTVNATVVYFDPDDDLAVLRTSLSGDPLPLASRDPRKGATLFAPGFPQGGEFQVKTAVFEGSIEVRGESIYGAPLTPRRYLALESSLEPGNSGSPVVDQGGNVVGVASAVSRKRRELGVAVPYERLASAVETARFSAGAVGTGSCHIKED